MSVVKFERRNRYSRAWPYRRTRAFGLIRYRVTKFTLLLGLIAVLLAALLSQRLVDGNASVLTAAGPISVIDGDTVRADRQVYRLVGFDTPESGALARCERERTLAAAATNRLRQLIAGGELSLQRVPCACRPGTKGTQACNHGRLCGVLKARDRDVGPILISEGLARPYVCGRNGCPRREGWCG